MRIAVLVIGAGGREHALAWTLALSKHVSQVYVAPGNAGTRWEEGTFRAPCSNVSTTGGIDELLKFAVEKHIGLTVVGPETPLAEGIVDAFRQAGLTIFGPTKAAAQLETSKAFAREFMRVHNIPSPQFTVFTAYDKAREYALQHGGALVVKADGLAGGKGVIVCDDTEAVIDALRRLMIDQEFGDAGQRVILEERLDGREVSVLALTDGKEVFPLPAARDHKRLLDGDQGPNTGGMGVYAPVPDVSAAQLDDIYRTILAPTVWHMGEMGIPYTGVLYAGIMITAAGPKVLEFNCRFGDPETQAILPLLDGDLAELLLACTEERLFDYIYEGKVHWHSGACVAVVASAAGYPMSYTKGTPIEGIQNIEEALVFHAGTQKQNGQLVTAGGRVLTVSARGATMEDARRNVYAAVEKIHFEGIHFRKDIGL